MKENLTENVSSSYLEEIQTQKFLTGKDGTCYIRDFCVIQTVPAVGKTKGPRQNCGE